MATTTKTELQQENDRLKAELAELKIGQENPFKSNTQLELTMHEVYLGARKKMTVGVVAVLSIVGIASGGSLYLEFLKLKEHMFSNLKFTMEEQLKIDINSKIKSEESRINRIVDSEMKNVLDSARRDILFEINKINDKTRELEQASNKIVNDWARVEKEAIIATKKIRQTVIDARKKATRAKSNATNFRLDQTTATANAECDKQIAGGANYSIKQLVSKTDKTYKERPYYKNSFSVAVVGKGNKEYSTATTECFINAIDLVVYTLNERWFKPNEIVRITRNDSYSFSTNVWGSTAVKVEIYLKDNSEPLHRCGRFVAKTVTKDNPEFFTEANCQS